MCHVLCKAWLEEWRSRRNEIFHVLFLAVLCHFMEEFCKGVLKELWRSGEGALELESNWSSTWGLCIEEWCAWIWCLLLKCLYEQSLCSDSLNRAKPVLGRGLHCLRSYSPFSSIHSGDDSFLFISPPCVLSQHTNSLQDLLCCWAHSFH